MKNSIPISRLLLLFWFGWFLLAATSNLMDYLINIGAVASHKFSSGNYELMTQVVSRYSLSKSLTPLLFPVVITVEMLICLSFMASMWQRLRISPYLFACGWWCLFLIADEFFIAYQLEATHGLLLALSLLSLIVEDKNGKI